jgi:predicted TIM-barrel fold metal-dependent hydrolase
MHNATFDSKWKRKAQSPNCRITRRAMLIGVAQAGIAASVPSRYQPSFDAKPSAKLHEYQIWDMHGHLSSPGNTPEEKIDNLLQFADRMGIERVIVFMGYPWAYDPSPDEVQRQNDQVLQAIEHSRGRAFGFVYLNPKYTEESIEELDRCVRDGPMVGVKLWVAVHCHEKCLDPIVRHAAHLKAPVLQHTWYKITGNLPGESTAVDLAKLAARHPTASFIAAHAGGDWERGIRAVRSTTNITADICGGDPTAGFVEMAVRELGAERVMYGSDFAGRSFASQLAKVLGANIPENAKRLILAGNIKRMLAPILTAKGIPI